MNDNRILFMIQHMKIRGLSSSQSKREMLRIVSTYSKGTNLEEMSSVELKTKASELYADYIKDNELYYQRTDIIIMKVDYYSYDEDECVISLDSGVSKFKVSDNTFTMGTGRRSYTLDFKEDLSTLNDLIRITSNKEKFRVPNNVRHQYCAIWLYINGKVVRTTRRNMTSVIGSYVEIASSDGKYIYRTVGVGGDFVNSREEVYNSSMRALLPEPIGSEITYDEVVHYSSKLSNGSNVKSTLCITGLYKAEIDYSTYNYMRRELSNKGELNDLDSIEVGKYIYQVYTMRMNRKYRAFEELHKLYSESRIEEEKRRVSSDWRYKYTSIEEAILDNLGVVING